MNSTLLPPGFYAVSLTLLSHETERTVIVFVSVPANTTITASEANVFAALQYQSGTLDTSLGFPAFEADVDHFVYPVDVESAPECLAGLSADNKNALRRLTYDASLLPLCREQVDAFLNCEIDFDN